MKGLQSRDCFAVLFGMRQAAELHGRSNSPDCRRSFCRTAGEVDDMAEIAEKYCVKITLRVLADYFLAEGTEGVELESRRDVQLDGIQILTGNISQKPGTLYICQEGELPAPERRKAGAAFVVQGEREAAGPNPACSILWVRYDGPFLDFVNEIQAVWDRYGRLRERMMEIAAGDGSLEDVCELAMEHFQNPAFIHDEYFNILASKEVTEDSFHFDYNQSTDSFTESIELINLFRTDKNYKKTLQTVGGQIYSSEFSENDALYANLWDEGLYRGRIVVTQQESAVRAVQKGEICCFAELALEIMKRRNIRNDNERQRLREIFEEIAEGRQVEAADLQSSVQKLGWDISDSYIAGCIVASDEEITRLSVKTICSDIERKISGILAFSCGGCIYFLLNLSISEAGLEDFRSKMSYIIREGLLKAGISTAFHHLTQCGEYFVQALGALEYGRHYRPTDWYHEFQTYLLPCWLREGTSRFGLDLMEAPAIRLLKKYDREHETELCPTLETFLNCERSCTLASQVLKIHRSTLLYRLKRITELTGLNLDDQDTRFYLNLSFYAEKYQL